MIYWIECPLKWNQWTYSRATSICWDYGTHGFRSLLYPLRRLRSISLMWKVWGVASGHVIPPLPAPKVAPHFKWVFKSAGYRWWTLSGKKRLNEIASAWQQFIQVWRLKPAVIWIRDCFPAHKCKQGGCSVSVAKSETENQKKRSISSG